MLIVDIDYSVNLRRLGGDGHGVLYRQHLI